MSLFNYILFVIFAVFSFLLVSYFCFKKNFKAASIMIIIGFITMSFTNLEKLSKFKAGSFEATMRDDLNKAKKDLTLLQNLAIELSEPILTLLTMQDRMFQYLPKEDKIEIKNDIIHYLVELQTPQKQIDKVSHFFDAAIVHDHLERIKELASESTECAEINEYLETIDAFDNYSKIDINHLKQLLIKCKSNSNFKQINETIKDLDYYLQNSKLRRPELWQG